MDPSKSASAPPPEKAPPPYHDSPSPGYLQPEPIYPPLPPGYSPSGEYVGAGYGQQPCPLTPQYLGQPVVIGVQPVEVAQQPLANPYNDYLGYSIFTMLCCCLPIGVSALIFSIFTREANRAGSQTDAERNSRMARTLNHVALGVGLGLLILYVIYVLVIVLS